MAESVAITVLVCFAERKRPVTINQSATFKKIRLAIVNAFLDVLPSTSKSTTQDLADILIVQLKSEEWDGELIDIKDGYPISPDKSVLKAMLSKVQVGY